jgi:transcriptional regulator with XRE-family HTH domain
MAQPAFGLLLQRLREERRLSLRELGQLAEIDHAYIYRLENGEKESPSEEALNKLIRALKAPKREADMLRYLAAHPQVDPGLVEYALTDRTITIEEFSAAAGVAYRGTGRPDYAKTIERIRRLWKEEEDGNG